MISFFFFLTFGKTLVKSVKVSMPIGSQIPSLLTNLAICSDYSFISVTILLCCFCGWQLTLSIYWVPSLGIIIDWNYKLKSVVCCDVNIVCTYCPFFQTLMIFFWCHQKLMFGFCFERNCRALLYKSLLVLNSCNVVVPWYLCQLITSQTTTFLTPWWNNSAQMLCIWTMRWHTCSSGLSKCVVAESAILSV